MRNSSILFIRQPSLSSSPSSHQLYFFSISVLAILGVMRVIGALAVHLHSLDDCIKLFVCLYSVSQQTRNLERFIIGVSIDSTVIQWYQIMKSKILNWFNTDHWEFLEQREKTPQFEHYNIISRHLQQEDKDSYIIFGELK